MRTAWGGEQHEDGVGRRACLGIRVGIRIDGGTKWRVKRLSGLSNCMRAQYWQALGGGGAIACVSASVGAWLT